MHVIVRSDHKPLKAIFSKPIDKAPPRIQRFLLRLQKYDLLVEFTPGSQIPVADALSRAYLTQPAKPEVPEQEIRCHVHSIIKGLPVSATKLDEIKRETAKDKSLQALKRYIQEGCEALYWPGMSSEITDMISRCSTCVQLRRKHQREPLIPLPPVTEAWTRVGTDLFKMQGKDYLLVVDYHTNYPEISLLPDTTSSTVIKHTKSIFARHRIPNVVISDNGPQFASKEYQEFAEKWEFQHITSSPYHPEANGKAERTVQTIKTLLKKALKDEEDPYLALMNFRACPSPDGTPSPATMLMNRKLRTRLPRMNQEKSHLDKAILEKQQKQKQYYDAKTKPLPPLAEGSTVRIHRGKSWDSLAQVVKTADSPRSYILQDEAGKILRRNRRDLLHTN